MPTIRIWTVESEYDAKVVKCLANKLATHLQLSDLSIQSSGRNAVPKKSKKRISPSDTLKIAVHNYLKQDDCIIFLIDNDSPMSSYQRRQEPNSFINQITQIVEDSDFTDKVFLAWAVQELEAWLLVDCLGVFCYFASKTSQYRTNCRYHVSKNKSLARLINNYQKGDTENIVEAEIGGSGAKEYLIKFSEKIMLALNPKMPHKNIRRGRYSEHMSPEVAEHVLIDQNTLLPFTKFGLHLYIYDLDSYSFDSCPIRRASPCRS